MEIYNELSGCRLLMMHWRCEKTPCMQVVINIIVLYIYNIFTDKCDEFIYTKFYSYY